MQIGGHTKVFGIIGDPVAHSMSPLFQNRFADLHGIDAVYVPFHVRPDDVVTALEGMRAIEVVGFNVTVPHKEAVLEMVEADLAAQTIGAVNTVWRDRGGWRATNTDWHGVMDVLQGLGARLTGTEVLMFGAGGTARAVLHAMAESRVQRLRICNRNRERLERLTAHAARHYPNLVVEAVAWDRAEVEAASEGASLLVNTTSIGLGEVPGTFPFELHGHGLAMDAVYRPDGKTPFVTAACHGGRRAVDGLPMLVAQGAASFRFWHGEKPDWHEALHWLEERLGRGHHAIAREHAA
ncbi:MAG TPA: shikimate dehydrogenase [Mariprofundaceae bacterium]|nr:shikimate dehydrogenase [Mariprofundaceae bacterium]